MTSTRICASASDYRSRYVGEARARHSIVVRLKSVGLYGALAVLTVGIGLGAAGLPPLHTVVLIGAVAGVVLLPLFAHTLGLAWVPITMLAGSALLPLWLIAGHPADNYIAGGMFLLALFALLTRRGYPVLDLVVFGFVLLTFAILTSSPWGDPPAIFGTLRIISYVFAWLVLVSLTNRQLRRAFNAALGVGLILAASVYAGQIGIVALPSYADAEGGEERAGGLIGHPNFAGYFISLLLIRLVGERDVPSRYRILAFGFLVGALLATESRGAIGACALAILILVSRWWKYALPIGIGVYVLFQGSLIGVIDRFNSFSTSGGLSGQNSAAWRLAHWKSVLGLHDRWDLTGLGWQQSRLYLPGELYAHNGYLEVWADLGWLGVLGLFVLILGLMRRAISAGITAVAILVFAVAANINDSVILYPPSTYLLLLLLTLPSPERSDPSTRSTSSAAGADARTMALEPG